MTAKRRGPRHPARTGKRRRKNDGTLAYPISLETGKATLGRSHIFGDGKSHPWPISSPRRQEKPRPISSLRRRENATPGPPHIFGNGESHGLSHIFGDGKSHPRPTHIFGDGKSHPRPISSPRGREKPPPHGPARLLGDRQSQPPRGRSQAKFPASSLLRGGRPGKWRVFNQREAGICTMRTVQIGNGRCLLKKSFLEGR